MVVQTRQDFYFVTIVNLLPFRRRCRFVAVDSGGADGGGDPNSYQDQFRCGCCCCCYYCTRLLTRAFPY